MKVRCKPWPGKHPAFPEEKFHWVPIINVKLIYQHSSPTKWFECFVDSGSPYCIFHASVAAAAGIRRLEDGVEDELGGVFTGVKAPMYFHKVKMLIGAEQIQTMAGFSLHLSVAGILGRRGLFDNFSIKFDPTEIPPMLELDRIYRT